MIGTDSSDVREVMERPPILAKNQIIDQKQVPIYRKEAVDLRDGVKINE